MLKTVLAIDKDIDTYRHHVPVWAKYGLEVQYAATANEAINRLANGSEFLLIAVNEERGADFTAQLRQLHDVTSTQIHVFSRSGVMQELSTAASLDFTVELFHVVRKS